MAIDANDVKILVHSSLHLVLKFCWQCLKDHPIVFVFVLLLLIFYIFLPSLFILLFYISPLVICTAIVLQRQINYRYQSATNTTKSADGSIKVSNDNRSTPQDSVTPRTRLRPTIQAAMSRRTFKKHTYKESGTPVMADLKDDTIFRCLSDVMPMKSREKDVAYDSNSSVGLASDRKEKGKVEKQEDGNGKAKAQELKQEKGKFVVEWTEDDKRNQMDLDFSDVERNRRLESLIAKRRAKKTLSMVPQRNLQGHVTPILIERFRSDIEDQPGSAPSVLLPTKNPFDLPYDPSEEKPVLIGDGFEEEFFIAQPKDMHYSKHGSFSYVPPFVSRHVEDPPIASYGSRFQRHSDAREIRKKFSEQLSREVQVKNIKNDCHEEAGVLPQKAEDNSKLVDLSQHVSTSHEENVSPTAANGDRVFEGGSPVLNDEANYPADSESLVFGGDQNSSVNSDDEDHDAVSTSCVLIDSPASGQPQYSKQNLRSSKDKDIDSTDADIVFDQRESSCEESENMNMPGALTLEASNLLGTSDCLVNEYVDNNSALDEDGEYQQHASLDLDFGSIESSCGSVSPVTHHASVAQHITIDTGTSPVIRLQDTLPAVGSASTSTEQNIDTYIHLPSNEDQRIVFQDGGDSMLHHGFQASLEMGEPEVLDLNSSPRSLLISPPDEDSEPTRSSLNSPSPRSNIHFDGEQVDINPPSRVPLDEMALKSSESQNGNKELTEHSLNPSSLAMQPEQFVEQVEMLSKSPSDRATGDIAFVEGISNLPRSREEHTATTSEAMELKGLYEDRHASPIDPHNSEK